MKAFLMHRDRDFEPAASPPVQAPQLIQDLGLNALLNAMAAGDPFLLEVTRIAVLGSLGDVGAICYRQDMLRDRLANPATVRGMYRLVVETVEAKKKHYWGFRPGARTRFFIARSNSCACWSTRCGGSGVSRKRTAQVSARKVLVRCSPCCAASWTTSIWLLSRSTSNGLNSGAVR